MVQHTSHMGAKLLYHVKRIHTEGDITEIKIWKVPKDDSFKDGVKYSLTYVHSGERIFGYDNERGKGHHEHRYDQEEMIEFSTWIELLNEFQRNVKIIRGELYGNESQEY